MRTSTGYVRPQTAQQAALREIRRWLIAGRLKPGDQVIQDVVASEVGVSVVQSARPSRHLTPKYIPKRGFFVNSGAARSSSSCAMSAPHWRPWRSTGCSPM